MTKLLTQLRHQKFDAKRDRRAVVAGQHIVYKTKTTAERVRLHVDPIRELMGEPAPGQSALDKLLAALDDNPLKGCLG